MGNRATVIFTTDRGDISPAIYLHWNGGPESVYAFLEELDRREVRADADYEAARFAQIVGEFFDADGQGGLSLGIVNGPAAISAEHLWAVQTDQSDNGFYVVNRSGSWGTVVRRFLSDWQAGGLEEMSVGQVLAEQARAEIHEYRPALREFFLGLAGRRAAALA